MSELVPTSTELVIPLTGEVISLDDPASCARVMQEIRELEYKLRTLKGHLTQALVQASRAAGTKTLHYPNVTVTVSTPEQIAWDYEVLTELLEAGLPEERFNDLVLIEQSYKINNSVAKSIAGSNDVYAEIIQRAQARVPKTPSVSVAQAKRA